MAIKQKLVAAGLSWPQAQALAGTVASRLSAAGTTQATAYAMSLDDVQIFATVGAGTGAVLPATLSAGDQMTVANFGTNALSLYPPVGGTIANGAANAAVSVPANKTALVTCIDGMSFAAIVSS
jgi:hypothetical protein